jgi:hypothetical protein
MSGAGSRTKGHQWERDVANSLKAIDPTAKRNLEYQEGSGFDISMELPLKIQCKCQKRPNFVAALSEAESACKETSHMPLAAIKVTGKGCYALVKWSDMVRLLEHFYGKIEWKKS